MCIAFTYLREWYGKKIQSGNIYDDPVGQQSKTWWNAVAAYAPTYLSSINDFRERFSREASQRMSLLRLKLKNIVYNFVFFFGRKRPN